MTNTENTTPATEETFRELLNAQWNYRMGRASAALGRTLEDQRVHGPRLMKVGREEMARITAGMTREDAIAFVEWLRKEGV